MKIRKIDTIGVKPLLDIGEFGYDAYVAGADVGRVYIGTGTANIPIAALADVGVYTTHTTDGQVLVTVPNTIAALLEVNSVLQIPGIDYSVVNTTTVQFLVQFNGTEVLTIIDMSNVQTIIDRYTLSAKGQPLGLAELDAAGKVPLAQLPSYVDAILEVATYSALPVTGESSKIYIVVADETSNGDTSSYRWAGTVYAMVSNILTAADIKALYESNANTNEFSDIEQTKLSGIEDNATRDQTALEIETLYEGLTDTNKYTDAEKAKVEYISVSSAVDLNQFETTTQLGLRDAANRARANHTGTQALDTVTETTTQKIMTSDERIKLGGIETAATADQTASEIETLYEGVLNTNKYTDADLALVDVSTALTTAATTLPTAVNEINTLVATNSSNINVIIDSIAGLSSASGAFGATAIAIDIPINGTLVTLTAFDLKLDGSDPAIMELIPTTGAFILKRAGKYSFISSIYAKAIDKDADITPRIALTTSIPFNIGGDTIVYDDTFALVRVKKEGIIFPAAVLFEVTQAMLDYSGGEVSASLSFGHVEIITADKQLRITGFDSVLSTVSAVYSGFADHSQLTGVMAIGSHPAAAISVTTIGNFNSVDVQAMLEEFDSKSGSSRYDTMLSTKDVIDMLYTNGDLTAVRYAGDNGTSLYYRDVLTYTNGNLVNIKHYYGTTNLMTQSATTTLAYDMNDNLISTAYTE